MLPGEQHTGNQDYTGNEGEPVSDWHKQLAHRLYIARDINGWTQTELQRRSGVQSSLLSHYETGLQLPSLTNFRRVVEALDVPAGWILSLEDWKPGDGK